MATQLFEREPEDRPELDFRAFEPLDLLRLEDALVGRLDAGAVRFVVEARAVEERFAVAAAVRFDAGFLAARVRVVEPLDADFFAVEPPELLELDFFAAEPPPDVDFLADELPDEAFFAVEPPELLELDFFVAEPPPDVDFLAEEPPERDLLDVEAR